MGGAAYSVCCQCAESGNENELNIPYTKPFELCKPQEYQINSKQTSGQILYFLIIMKIVGKNQIQI